MPQGTVKSPLWGCIRTPTPPRHPTHEKVLFGRDRAPTTRKGMRRRSLPIALSNVHVHVRETILYLNHWHWSVLKCTQYINGYFYCQSLKFSFSFIWPAENAFFLHIRNLHNDKNHPIYLKVSQIQLLKIPLI